MEAVDDINGTDFIVESLWFHVLNPVIEIVISFKVRTMEAIVLIYLVFIYFEFRRKESPDVGHLPGSVALKCCLEGFFVGLRHLVVYLSDTLFHIEVGVFVDTDAAYLRTSMSCRVSAEKQKTPE